MTLLCSPLVNFPQSCSSSGRKNFAFTRVVKSFVEIASETAPYGFHHRPDARTYRRSADGYDRCTDYDRDFGHDHGSGGGADVDTNGGNDVDRNGGVHDDSGP